MEKKQNEKLRYGTITVRIKEDTKELLKKEKLKSGLSWNRFIYKLLKEKV